MTPSNTNISVPKFGTGNAAANAASSGGNTGGNVWPGVEAGTGTGPQGAARPRGRGPGVFVISLTPFDNQERFDEAGFRGHLRRIAAAGIGVYVGGAGSGEAYALEQHEARRVLEIAVEELRGQGAGAGNGRRTAHRP